MREGEGRACGGDGCAVDDVVAIARLAAGDLKYTGSSNYNGQDWPEEVQKSFLAYVNGGGGFVVVHAANNSFGKWKEYNKIIGVGGWGGRKIGRDGPWVHIVDGKVVRDSETKGNGGSHGPRHPFKVEHIDTTHPVTKGLPAKWMHQKDELYCRLCGPAENMEVQGFSYSPQSKRNEPMLMTISYGDGRVFHTPMGHDVEAMRCRGFFTIIQRGTEWAATGAVKRTAKVPDDFPPRKRCRWYPLPRSKHPSFPRARTRPNRRVPFGPLPDIACTGMSPALNTCFTFT